ncbi:interleukin-18 receptor accessory protein isoform X2 [Hemicordylus capensis]|uniref:interleukin-18 receptor accessory protein isoform X2 n=1 Tax=Hemicordylus capensis TaxID=884348 RepID=UPI002303EBF0|nr:interleukin-18 receptor accessory protein isoform X2 [Hemicordylus capensis]
MLTFCLLFLLLVKRAEVRDIDIAECLYKHIDVRYRAISDEKFVFSCDSPSVDPASVFNSSCLYESKVKWYWQPRHNGALTLLSHKTTNRVHRGNSLWFNPITTDDSGTYICRNGGRCVNIFIDVQTKKMAHCSDNLRNYLEPAVEQGESIACPGKKCFSHLQHLPDRHFLPQTSVKWYKNGKQVRLQKERWGLKLKQDKIILHAVHEKDSGTYICDYMLNDSNTRWTMRTIVSVFIISKDTQSPPTILEPSGKRTLEAELGKPLLLLCKVQFGFERIPSSSVQWYRQIGKNKELLQNTRVNSRSLGGTTFSDHFKLMEVSEADLSSHFICLAQNSVGNSTGVFKLKRKTAKALHFLLALCCAIITVLGLFLGSTLAYQYWIEIVLLYRNYMAKDETVGDSSKADSTFLNEEQFALEVLPQILENKYGYKLCLTDRDILPGGAYTDDIVNAVKKSRRAIMILSPTYVNGQSVFELEAAVNTSLEDKTIKLILIQFESFQEPQSLPHKVKKALRVLPRIAWETSTSPTDNKQFWKKIRYHMPVKHTKGTEAELPSFFTPLVTGHEKPLQEKSG